MRIDLALAGYGVVGRAFVQLIGEKQEELRQAYGLDLRLIAVAGRGIRLHADDGLEPDKLLACGEGSEGLRRAADLKPGWRSEAPLAGDVLIEATPTDLETGEPGLSYFREAMKAGMDIVAISKGALVTAWAAIMEEARRANVRVRFSGATAAALPMLDLGLYSLAGCRIERIEGILNGTTNFLLSRMREEGGTYAEALAEARRRGIAETNPALDVSGRDSACKLLLLANRLLGAAASLADVRLQGIEGVTPADIRQAQADGGQLKLVASAYQDRDGRVWLEVGPRVLPAGHPLAGVHGTEKGVTFTTDSMGAVTVTGGASSPRGAAAAALKDILNLYRKDER
ncbi:homoserine dehydrogenase [Paenibacillus sp. J31TS4]|uniref:homoserine dehydrogenase n=1 Tax=Paenibacillus sp. J31TS4 TaxID=2807195 RepID=UPI001B11DC49|nr:homoserine dehydrogenase [Paenibacillus sp. J31TS4]GIP38752.1 homoserine dehydrogenase [Paenibacillus sp. J31TS4]